MDDAAPNHVTLDDYSRLDSPLHRRDARAKLILLVYTLVFISTANAAADWLAVVALLAAGFAFARLPVRVPLSRALAVLPFTGTFALITAWMGDSARAYHLLTKSYASAVAVVLVIATTPAPSLFHAAEAMRVPPMLVEVIQLIHRYLFVLTDQARRMRNAILSRGASSSFRASAGSAAVLFARSYQRAENLHRSMLSRGYTGSMISARRERFTVADAAFAALPAAALAAVRILN